VRAQCGYVLLRNNLVSGVHRVLVHSGDILKSCMVQCVKYNVHKISMCDTKIVCGGKWHVTQK
jgi:hypothetical protein